MRGVTIAKSNLSKLLESTSLCELKSLVTAKERLEKLLEKKSMLEKDLSSHDNQIEYIQKSLGNSLRLHSSISISLF